MIKKEHKQNLISKQHEAKSLVSKEEADKDSSSPVRTDQQLWMKPLTAISSVCFLLVLLLVGLQSNPIPDRQFMILRTILALAAAGFVMGIPAFIIVKIAFKHVAIAAMGALAVFVIIYFFSPSI